MALVGIAMAVGVGVAAGVKTEARGVEAGTSEVTYNFTDKDWGATIGSTTANWTNGKSGYSFESSNNARGIQVTTGASGANGTSPVSYTSISKITVGVAKSSSGAGTVTAYVGSTSVGSKSSSFSTTTNAWACSVNNLTGNVKINVTCTTNSLYVKYVTITYQNNDPSVKITHASLSEGAINVALSNKNGVTFGLDTANEPDGATYDWTFTGSNGSFNSSTSTFVPSAVGDSTLKVEMKNSGTKVAEDQITIHVLDVLDTSNGDYHLVTNLSNLTDGDHITIAAAGYDYAIGTAKTNNYDETAISKSNGIISSGKANVLDIKLESTGTANTYYFKVGSLYLYAASSSSNYLKAAAKNTVGDNGKFLITLSNSSFSIVAQGSNTRNDLRYNSNDGLFSCYASGGQKAVVVYEFVTYADEINAFASTFVTAMSADGVCGSTAETYNRDNSTAVSGLWSTYKTKFEALTSGAKALFLTTSDDATVARAKNLYDHVVTRYSLATWTNVPAGAVNVENTLTNNVSTTTLVIIIISTVSLVAVASYFVIRRRKENN